MNRNPKERSTGVRVATSERDERSGSEAAEAKRKLEALFGGQAGAPPSGGQSQRPRSGGPPPRGPVFASPRKSLGRSPSEYRMRLERLRSAREPAEIKTAADAFLQHHQLPDDTDILYKVLQHTSEQVVRQALGQLSSLLMQGRLNGTMLLAQHLKELGARVQEDATRSYVEGMQSQLERMK